MIAMNHPILIADDEPLARRTLRDHLRQLGCAGPIHEAGDGQSAAELANKERPGLIFLDIVMPGATGLEVLAQLEYEPKVIFTPAYDQYAVTAFELGALDYVLKPFGRDRLSRVLQRAQVALNGTNAPVLTRAQESLQSARGLFRSRWQASNACRARMITLRFSPPQRSIWSASGCLTWKTTLCRRIFCGFTGHTSLTLTM